MSTGADLNEAAEFIRDMKALGAAQVRVGDVEVVFGVEFVPAEPPRPPSRDELAAAARREERIRFAHAEGFPDDFEFDTEAEEG